MTAASAWAFHLHPETLGIVVALLGGYAYALRRFGPLFHPGAGEPAATRKQKAFFVGGVVSFYAATGWPVHDLAENYLYSAHMVQHIILGFITPPLLLLGTPEWLGRLLLGRGVFGRLYRGITRPLVAALFFNAALAIVHWPQVNELMLASAAFHESIHLLFIVAALAMWSVLYSPLPEIARRVSPPGKMAYLFAQTLLPTVPASFLTFGDRALYRGYENFPRLASWLTPLEDMRLAGLIMKVGGGLLLWIILAVMFFRWANREEVAGIPRGGGGGGTPPQPEPTPTRPSTSWS